MSKADKYKTLLAAQFAAPATSQELRKRAEQKEQNSKKLETTKSSIEDIFSKEPYGIRLSFMDIFGTIAQLENLFDSLWFFLDAEEDLAVVNVFYKSCPKEINSDEDLVLWLKRIEESFPTNEVPHMGSVDFKPYETYLPDFKKAINEAIKNKKSFSYSKAIKLTEWTLDCNYLDEHFSYANLSLLGEDQIKMALIKKEQVRQLLHEVEEMFGELAMQFLKFDEKTGRPIYPLTSES
jgi:hypothetical protein